MKEVVEHQENKEKLEVIETSDSQNPQLLQYLHVGGHAKKRH